MVLLKKWYNLATTRELIRISRITKIQITNYVFDTSFGAVTIKAFKLVEPPYKNYLKLVNTNAGPFFYSNAAIEWLVLIIEKLHNWTLFIVAFLILLLLKG